MNSELHLSKVLVRTELRGYAPRASRIGNIATEAFPKMILPSDAKTTVKRFIYT